MTLLRVRKQTERWIEKFGDKEVHRVDVQCPYFPQHGANLIHVTEGPWFPGKDGWNVWHFEVKKEPQGETPGLLVIQPSIGLQATPKHKPDCHLGPGELPFVWD